MVTLEATTKDIGRATHLGKGHTLRGFRNKNGGYHVTCMDRDWWTTVPAGERLKGWDDPVYD